MLINYILLSWQVWTCGDYCTLFLMNAEEIYSCHPNQNYTLLSVGVNGIEGCNSAYDGTVDQLEQHVADIGLSGWIC